MAKGARGGKRSSATPTTSVGGGLDVKNAELGASNLDLLGDYWHKDWTDDDISEFIAETGLPLTKGQAIAYLEGLHQYTKTQDVLYTADDVKKNSGFDRIKNLDDAVAALPKYNGEVYRGMNVDTKTAKGQAFLGMLEEGNVIGMGHPSSWTHTKSVAQNFAQTYSSSKVSVIFKVKNKSGASIKKYSNYPSEDEVLHPSTSKYKIKKINKSTDYDGITTMTVELDEL